MDIDFLQFFREQSEKEMFWREPFFYDNAQHLKPAQLVSITMSSITIPSHYGMPSIMNFSRDPKMRPFDDVLTW